MIQSIAAIVIPFGNGGVLSNQRKLGILGVVNTWIDEGIGTLFAIGNSFFAFVFHLIFFAPLF
jgi:hypothetical protein